jgi:hypothetical protein
MRFCSRIRRAQDFGTEERVARLGRFQVESIVADEAENLAVAIDTIVSKHLAGRDIASATALVNDKLYEVGITCHRNQG